MYPDQNQNQYPIDYLNQIAAPEKKPSPVNKIILIIIIGLGILTLIVGGLMISRAASRGSQSRPQMAARLHESSDIVRSAQKNLKSNTLRDLNSNLQLFLTNTNRDLKDAGLDGAQVESSILKREKDLTQELNARLEDARLNATFDEIYAREMAYRLETIMLLMRQVHANTNSTELKEYLDTNIKELDNLQSGFSDY